MQFFVRISIFCIAISLCVLGPGASCSSKRAPSRAALTCPPHAAQAARQDVCIYDACGNGVLEPGEACDDGNVIDGDGCSRNCQSTEACGNSVVDRVVGEVCDDGNTESDARCCADCRSCVELAVPERAAVVTPEPARPQPPAPACTAEDLERALAELNAARERAAAEATRADQIMQQARTAGQRGPQGEQPGDDSAAMRMVELERANKELQALLALEREALAELRKRMLNGRSFEL